MKMNLVPVLLIAVPCASAQTILTISEDSFNYAAGSDLGGQSGGTGFTNAWDGGNGTVINAPGLDGVGNKATTSVNFAVSFRTPDPTGFDHLLDGGQFGADDTTIWIGFHSVRSTATNGGYGGFSLFDLGGTERLFVGSPWMTDQWGLQEYPTGTHHLVPNSNVDVPTELVVRIDFQVGVERLRLWLDPLVPNPDGPADIDIPYPELDFESIRIGSGGGSGDELYDFDGLRLETPSSSLGTNYCLSTTNSTGAASAISASGSDSVSANDLVLTANNMPDQPGIFIAGPTSAQIPFFNGFLCMDPNGLQRFSNTAPASGGVITEAVDIPTSAPGGLNVIAGSSYFYQRWFRDPMAGGGNANFSDGIEIVYTP